MNRASFEEFAGSEGLDIAREKDRQEGYADTETHLTWLAWKRATEVARERCATAIEALMDEKWNDVGDRPDYVDLAFYSGMHACLLTIREMRNA